jgi:hypothetical protein
MFRVQGATRKEPAAPIPVESLEDRAVLTAGAAAVEIQYLRAINHLNTLLQRRVTQIQSMLTARVAGVPNRFGTLNAALAGANPYFTASFQNALTAVDADISAEAQEAQGTLQAATAPVQSAAAQAQAAESRAQVEAASGELADTSEAKLSSEQAAVAQFWDRYYSSFNPLRAQLTR